MSIAYKIKNYVLCNAKSHNRNQKCRALIFFLSHTIARNLQTGKIRAVKFSIVTLQITHNYLISIDIKAYRVYNKYIIRVIYQKFMLGRNL